MYENYKREDISGSDKTMALLSHLSIFIFSIVMPAILYVVYKQKSRFTAFHALQALYYQIASQLLIVFLAGFIIMMIFAFGLDLDAFDSKPMSPDWIMAYTITLSSLGAYFIFIYGYAVIIGIRAGAGKIAKYPVIGNWAYKQVYEKQLGSSYNTISKDDRYSDIYSRDSNPFD